MPLNVTEKEIGDDVEDDDSLVTFQRKSQNVLVYCDKLEIDNLTNLLTSIDMYIYSNADFDIESTIAVFKNVVNYPYIECLMSPVIEIMSFIVVSAMQHGCLSDFIGVAASIDISELSTYSLNSLIRGYQTITDAVAKAEMMEAWVPQLCGQLIKISMRIRNPYSETEGTKEVIGVCFGELLFSLLSNYQEFFGGFCVENKNELFPINDELPSYILAGSILPEAVVCEDPAFSAFLIEKFNELNASVNSVILAAFKYLIDNERVPPENVVGFAVKISDINDILLGCDDDYDEGDENSLRVENPYKHIPSILFKALEIDGSLIGKEGFLNCILSQLCPSNCDKNNDDYKAFIDLLKTLEVTNDIVMKIHEIISEFEHEMKDENDEKAAEVLSKLSLEYLRVEPYKSQILALNADGDDNRIIEKIMTFCQSFPPE
jgi:hypothetical protein